MKGSIFLFHLLVVVIFGSFFCVPPGYACKAAVYFELSGKSKDKAERTIDRECRLGCNNYGGWTGKSEAPSQTGWGACFCEKPSPEEPCR